jgi:hypothetical protein
VVPHHLISGGDDGLVCCFDMSIRGEDDALVACMNAESAVARFGFFGPHAAFVWVTTRTETLSLWNMGTADRVAAFPNLLMQFLEAGVGLSYLVACHTDDETNTLQLLAGAHDGALAVLDVSHATVALRCLWPAADAPSPGAAGAHFSLHTSTVRSALWCRTCPPIAASSGDAAAGTPLGTPTGSGTVLLTAGEDACLCQWVDPQAASILGAVAVSNSASKGSKASGPVRKTALWRRAHRYSRAAAAAAGGGVADADAFGTREADPVSEPETEGTGAFDSEIKAAAVSGGAEDMMDEGWAAAKKRQGEGMSFGGSTKPNFKKNRQ